jgi:hypothetical protein
VHKFTDIRRRSYLGNLREYTRQLRTLASNHVDQARLASPLCHSLLLFTTRLINRIDGLKYYNLLTQINDITDQINNITHEIKWYRDSYVKELGRPQLDVPNEVSTCVTNIDEYLSTKLYWELGLIIKSQHEVQLQLLELIQGVIRSEGIYREQYRDLRALLPFSKQRFLSRLSILKKQIESPLFIIEDRKAQDKYYRNIFAAIGASLAAIWSLLADAQTYRLARSEDFGMRASLIALLIIVAYVFKDRIKENSRDYLNARMNSKFPDYRSYYIYKAGNSENTKLGSSLEWFSKIELKNIPPELLKLHHINSLLDPVSAYQHVAYHFRKTYNIETMKTMPGLPSSSFKEVLRFNLSRLSARFDDSAKRVLIPDDLHNFKLVETKKKYDMDLLVKITTLDQIGIAHYRVVLQKGIITKLKEKTKFTTINPTRSASDD